MFRIAVFMVFLAAVAWQDFRRREIAVWMFLMFGTVAVVLNLAEGILWSYLCGSIVGFSLLLASAALRGAVGVGDGCFFVVSGLFLGLTENVRLFCAALLLSSIYGLGIYVYKRVRYGVNAGKETLPFLSFAAAGELLIRFLGL